MVSSDIHANLLASIDSVLASLSFKPAKLTVALSGGLDSVALLHCAHNWCQQHQVQLSAHHVHHGLSRYADDWLSFCQSLCESLGVEFSSTKLTLTREGGESLEACARDARYQALATHETEVFLLAQHQDDQVETGMMMLLRGSGLAGLVGMPAVRQADGKWWLRPWLNIPRQQLHSLAVQQGWQWVEDESNQDVRFDRNFWRQTVLPVIEARYPSYRAAICRSQKLLRESMAIAEDLAAIDLQTCQTQSNSLRLGALLGLADYRAKNVLRHWLVKMHQHQPPSAVWLENLWKQLQTSRIDAEIRIPLPNAVHFVGVYRQELFFETARFTEFSVFTLAVDWHSTAGVVPIPHWQGSLHWQQVNGDGVRLDLLNSEVAILRGRQGGEKIKLSSNTPTKSLKQCWQEKGIPPWQREVAPLLLLADQLAWVPTLGYSNVAKAAPNEMGVVFSWMFD